MEDSLYKRCLPPLTLAVGDTHLGRSHHLCWLLEERTILVSTSISWVSILESLRIYCNGEKGAQTWVKGQSLSKPIYSIVWGFSRSVNWFIFMVSMPPVWDWTSGPTHSSPQQSWNSWQCPSDMESWGAGMGMRTDGDNLNLSLGVLYY